MDFSALRTCFLAADYTVDGVLARIGQAGQAGLGRNQTTPALRALGSAADPLATLIKLFILQRLLPASEVESTLPDLLTGLQDLEILDVEAGQVRALIDVRPYSSDDLTPKWIVSDLTPGLDTPPPPIRPDYVLGISPASTTLAQLTIRDHCRSALDLGTGCGVQSMHLVDHVDTVVATDLNPRALKLAAWTAELNQATVDLRAGDLYAAVADERFDLIVSNPPYVMSPPSSDGARLTYREATRSGDDLVREVVVGGIERLNPGGVLQVLGNWAIVGGTAAGQPQAAGTSANESRADRDQWGERIRSWLPETGVQALVIERERLDVFEYIELWLTDAGLAGTPDYLDQYERWLDYFDSLAITAVGMGWISVRRSGTDRSVIRTEVWPHAVAQPVGDALGDWLATASSASVPDETLWSEHWQLGSDTDAETIGRPGAADPEHLVYRQRTGLLRAVEVDTALGGVLGACDGELSLGVIVDAVAQLLEVDAAELRADLQPRIRELIADGFLRSV